MKNFEFEHEGKKLWYSRSLAVSLVSFSGKLDENGQLHIYVLVNQRGTGCEFNKFLWNIPGGFIDFGENAKQCAKRETFEETGVEVGDAPLYMHTFDTEPTSKRQTMIASYWTLLDYDKAQAQFSTEHSEPNEVLRIQWMDVFELDKHPWTRNQMKLIKAAYASFYCSNQAYNLMDKLGVDYDALATITEQINNL